jgi:pimeloyl-ACP methyl ester carboxylesterase
VGRRVAYCVATGLGTFRALIAQPNKDSDLMPHRKLDGLLFRSSPRSYFNRPHPVAAGATIVLAALAISAVVNRFAAKKAERDNPPMGKFVDVGGLLLHYVEHGTGEPLVLLHGNAGMIQDFASSGLIDKAARKYRVIVFDRPGFGYSERPGRTTWTHKAQAELIHEALSKIGILRATVLGHSWGSSVAIALALKYPELVSALILVSGYFYPTARADVVVLSGPAFPVVGDIMSHTISPILARIMRPLFLRKIFGPAPIPKKFESFPKEMALRPSQIRASAAESALMVPDAFASQKDYADLKMPVAIIAGEEDRLIDTKKQSARLHRDVMQSTLHRVPGVGHMVHQSATDAVMAAIDEAAGSRFEHRATT